MSAVIILAGGKSRRMGRDKLALTVGGQTLLEAAVARFSAVFDSVCISVAEQDKYPGIAAGRIADIYPGCGPLSGLHAALLATMDDAVFLVAADLPFSDPHAAKEIMRLRGDADVCIIKREDGYIEPLFGCYGRSILPVCEAALLAGEYKMTALLSRLDTRYISERDLGAHWDGRLLLNVNYPEDYEKIENHSRNT